MVDKERIKHFACPPSRVLSRLLMEKTQGSSYAELPWDKENKIVFSAGVKAKFCIMDSQHNKFHHYVRGDLGVCFGWSFLGAFVCGVLGLLDVVDRITEYPELKGTHKDHQVHLSSLHSTIPRSPTIPGSIVQTLLKFCQAWGWHFFGELVPVPSPLGKKFPAIQHKLQSCHCSREWGNQSRPLHLPSWGCWRP